MPARKPVVWSDRSGRAPAQGRLAVCVLLLAYGVGCQMRAPFLSPDPPTVPTEPSGIVLTSSGQTVPTNPALVKAQADLDEAMQLYRQGEYARARRIFNSLAEDKKNKPELAEEARYYEAECYRKEGSLPSAADTYRRLLLDFPMGLYREQSCRRLFDIACYWLIDTNQQMQAYEEVRQGKRQFVWPDLVHFDKSKPVLDERGRALQLLEQVHYSDPTGPTAPEALYLLGRVHFYLGNYREADHSFSQLIQMYKDSPKAAEAAELAIICKNMSTGGPDYDGRKVSEAMSLVHQARQFFPELAKDPEKSKFLDRQMLNLTLHMAERDFRTAEFYRRTNHPGSAYWYYEIVRRRYPGTSYAELATQKMQELHDQIEAQQAKQARGSIFDGPRRFWYKLWGQAEPEPDAQPTPRRTTPAGPPPMARPIPAEMMLR
jgi:TolA-binding protein